MIRSEEKTQEEIVETLENTLDMDIPKLEDFDYIREREVKNETI